MRSTGRDIAELFGYGPDDLSDDAVRRFRERSCPFSGRTCSKTDSSGDIVYGVCSVTEGATTGTDTDVVVCPERLYDDSYRLLREIAEVVWREEHQFIVGGSLENLRQRALAAPDSVVAFGQRSGGEVGTPGGKLSMDWVLQRYAARDGTLVPSGFVGVEVQSIDITGNYRDCWSSYARYKVGDPVHLIEKSGHGLNWANVHKRLLPQIIRKGNVYKRTESCLGFFFLTPETVFRRFEGILGEVAEVAAPRKDVLSIVTVGLGAPETGQIRPLLTHRQIHHPIDDVALAFVTHLEPGAPEAFENKVLDLLQV